MDTHNNLIKNFITYTAWLEVLGMIEYPMYGNWSRNDIHRLKVDFIRKSRENDFYGDKIDFKQIYQSIISKIGKDAPRLSDIHC